MNRRRRPKDQLKITRVAIVVTEAQKALIDRAARFAALSMSEWCRRAVVERIEKGD